MIGWLNKQPKTWAWKVHGHPHQANGIPDINCCHRGLFVAVEVKTPSRRDKVSEWQARRLQQIEEAGGIGIVACSLAELKKEFYERTGEAST